MIAYAGSIGRFHHGELDAKGFLLWEVGAAVVRFRLIETPARRTVDLVFEGLPDVEQIAKAAQDQALGGAYARVRWQVGEEERASVDHEAIKRALGEAPDVQLEGRVVPVVRSRAAGIPRATSLREKAQVWARATGSADGPLLERLEALAHREPSQIANAILAGDNSDQVEQVEVPSRADGSNALGPAQVAAPCEREAELELF